MSKTLKGHKSYPVSEIHYRHTIENLKAQIEMALIEI